VLADVSRADTKGNGNHRAVDRVFVFIILCAMRLQTVSLELLSRLFRVEAKLRLHRLAGSSVFAKVKDRLASLMQRFISWFMLVHRDMETTEDLRTLVFMGTYNGEDWIEEAVRSLQTMEFTNWHLLIVDDGSEDLSPTLVRQLASQHPEQITAVCLGSNARPVSNVNPALDWFLERPEFEAFCILDQDDIALPGMISESLRLMNPRVQVVRFKATRFNADLTQPIFTYAAYSQLLIRRAVIERVGKRIDRGQSMPTDSDYLERIERDALQHGQLVVLTHHVCQHMRVTGANCSLSNGSKRARILQQWITNAS
jgi:hypothetical protein